MTTLELNSCADFLNDFFWAQKIPMSIDVIDESMIAKDDDGNVWKDAEIYNFALNECLCFNKNGTLASGLDAAIPFVDRLKEDAKIFGVKITSFCNTD